MAGLFVQVVQTYPQIFRPKFDRVPVRPLVKASIDAVWVVVEDVVDGDVNPVVDLGGAEETHK